MPDPVADGPDHRCRVLLVDTRAERRALMRTVVETGRSGGVVVAQAATIVSAVASIDRYAVDAAVVEIQMPIDAGLAAIVALRSASPSVVIVVCSFHRDQSTVEDAYEAGANVYLTKPVSPKDLHAACRTTVSAVQSSKLSVTSEAGEIQARSEQARTGSVRLLEPQPAA